jgi:hypothetical protein
MFLDNDQIHKLTKKVRPSAQARELKRLGIRHGVRGNGSIVVMEAAVDAVLGAGTVAKLARKTQPNFENVA